MGDFTDELDTLGVTGHWLCDETSGGTANDRISSDDGTIPDSGGVDLNQTGGGEDGNASFGFRS